MEHYYFFLLSMNASIAFLGSIHSLNSNGRMIKLYSIESLYLFELLPLQIASYIGIMNLEYCVEL